MATIYYSKGHNLQLGKEENEINPRGNKLYTLKCHLLVARSTLNSSVFCYKMHNILPNSCLRVFRRN